MPNCANDRRPPAGAGEAPLILAINPGSTSTKIALYSGAAPVFNKSIGHPQERLERYENILDQVPMRRELVLQALKEHGRAPENLGAVVGRGGLLPPVETGGYLVNRRMLDMIHSGEIPAHASNLGAVLAHQIAGQAGVAAYIYDAVSANEFPPVARITGMREIERKSFYHVLNSRAAARKYALSTDRRYEDLNLIVSHLGGGITVGAHLRGRIVDSLSDDNGPFAPERAGSVPLLEVIDMCYSGQYSREEMKKKVRGKGGLRSLLGTSDGREIARRVREGDQYARLVMEAQAYQIAKGVALMLPALRGVCDAVILTGGLAHDTFLMDKVREYAGFAANIVILPGEFEMEALALGGLRMLRGEEQAHTF